MADDEFIPLTSQIGTPEMMYRLQIGSCNGKWAVRLFKDKKVLDTYVFKEEDTEEGLPNQGLIVGFVLRTIAIPNVNPHEIMKATKALLDELNQRRGFF